MSSTPLINNSTITTTTTTVLPTTTATSYATMSNMSTMTTMSTIISTTLNGTTNLTTTTTSYPFNITSTTAYNPFLINTTLNASYWFPIFTPSPIIITTPQPTYYWYPYIYYIIVLFAVALALTIMKVAFNRRRTVRNVAYQQRRVREAAQGNQFDPNNNQTGVNAIEIQNDKPPAYDELIRAQILKYERSDSPSNATMANGQSTTTLETVIDLNPNDATVTTTTRIPNTTNEIASSTPPTYQEANKNMNDNK